MFPMAAPRLPGRRRSPPLHELNLPPAFRWKSNDGRVHEVHNMDSVHIERCIAMMDRRRGSPQSSLQKDAQDAFWIMLLTKELKLRKQAEMMNLIEATKKEAPCPPA